MICPGDLVIARKALMFERAKGIWLFDKPTDQQFKIRTANLKLGEIGVAICVQNTWSNLDITRAVHSVFVITHDGVGWCAAVMLEVI